MKRKTLAALCLPLIVFAPLAAQEAKKEERPAASQAQEKGMVTRIFEVKHRDPKSLIGPLAAFGAKLQPSSEFRAIAVTGLPDVVAAIGEAITRFDVPPKNVEITMYLLTALAKGDGDSIPKELDAVVKQLRGSFQYQGYRLMDSLFLRSREGLGANTSGAGAAAADATAGPFYHASYRSVDVSQDAKGNVIKISRLQLTIKAPGVPSGASFGTDVDIREGQKVVIGKTGFGPDAIVLVLTAKVID